METEAAIPLVTERDWMSLYDHVRQRVQVHTNSAVKRNKRYKKMAGSLHALIPLTSLALTVLAGSDFPRQHMVTAGVAILLTALTGTNYALEPGRRYAAYADICIQLHDVDFQLETKLEALKTGPVESIIVVLNAANEQLSAIGRVMAGLPVAREHLG